MHACTLLGYHNFESPSYFFLNYNPVIVQKFSFFSKTGDFSQFLGKKFLTYISLILIFCNTHCCHDTSYNAWQHFLEWFVLFIISATIIYNHRFIFQKKTDDRHTNLQVRRQMNSRVTVWKTSH